MSRVTARRFDRVRYWWCASLNKGDDNWGVGLGLSGAYTRALLNLISNGFYAATKRKGEVDGGSYEPELTAATKNLGDSVEIRIRDNGAGISPEVKEKLFNPFFTTKPAGEGTGLGLSISHDIIVKQHGGSIEVDTKLGEFTEFRIVLPRTGPSLIKPGGVSYLLRASAVARGRGNRATQRNIDRRTLKDSAQRDRSRSMTERRFPPHFCRRPCRSRSARLLHRHGQRWPAARQVP